MPHTNTPHRTDACKPQRSRVLPLAMLCLLPAISLAQEHETCVPDAGSCFVEHPGPGCNIAECCDQVCDEFNPLCCDFSWDATCANAALQMCDASDLCPGEGNCYLPHDSPGCEKEDCCSNLCAAMPECCQFEWTAECAELALFLCPCGAPGSGSCTEDNGIVGCEDEDCCTTVCNMDAFCCGSGWDAVCVQEAGRYCGLAGCEMECPPGATLEAEICGHPDNDGCNVDDPDPEDPPFTSISCGQVFCGKSFASGARDTDWYRITANEPTQLSWTVASEFPTSLMIVEGDCDTHFSALTEAYTDNCLEGTTDLCVAPGTYYLFVSPAIEERSMRGGAPCPSCAEDLNNDGLVGAADLAMLLGNWGDCEECIGDLDEDLTVGAVDLAFLLGAWGPCDQPPWAVWGNDYTASLQCQSCTP